MKSVIVLDDFHDRSLLFSIMCTKSFTLYSYLRYGFHLPVVLISAVLSILNGNLKEMDARAINVLNIVANALTALLWVISNKMTFETRAAHFKAKSVNFIKLHREIEKYLLPFKNIEDIDDDNIKSVMTSYDIIVENLQYDIPRSICNSVRKTYVGKRTLPNIIADGSHKQAVHRQNSICSIMEGCKPIFVERNEGGETDSNVEGGAVGEVIVMNLDHKK